MKKQYIIIKNWAIKDIEFHVSNRKKATSLVKKLLANGWELYDGDIIDGLVYGDNTVHSDDFEEIQLHKTTTL